ncbi:aspartate aminotransferase family protein [Amphibiibacter pelophylacis]|uniref:Acetylornithine/succinyldiaminopimelate transaminase n=1 Tax=Amphibiibacter pelophylacis TaxID=1799477 RepID=A0ACC6P3L8_9BURK
MTAAAPLETLAGLFDAPVSRADFDRHLMATYAPAAFVPVRASGLDVWDQDGRRYLDFSAGIAVTSLGHCHPAVTQALAQQAGQIGHLSNVYTNEPVLRLARVLTGLTFADRVFFCNSGAEANEGALKLARRLAYNRGDTQRQTIVSCTQSFHGRTVFTVSVGGQPKYMEGFGPTPQAIVHVPFNDLDAAAAAMGPHVAAFIVEPVQGEGGVTPAHKSYLEGLRALCDQHGALLIFDEVQTGVGRTGHLYAHQAYGVSPDVMTTAKALGNGFPMGAVLATEAAAAGLTVGTHGTTYGGNPLAGAVALQVLREVTHPGFLEQVRERADQLAQGLEALVADHPALLASTRGMGLLRGLVLGGAQAGKSAAWVKQAQDAGLLVLAAGPDVVRLAPALVCTAAQVDEALALLRQVAQARARA